MNILDDLKATGARITTYSFDVPLCYARLVQAELTLRGVSIKVPENGDEIDLEFTTGQRLTLLVH